MKKIDYSTIEIPRTFRKGQNIFCFLEFLATKKNVPLNQNARMADPFHLSDKEWDEYYKEYLNYVGV